MVMSSIDLANFAIEVSGFVISVLGFLLVFLFRQTEREIRRFFLVIFSMLTSYTASAIVCQLSGTVLLSRITLFAESLFSSLLIPLITLYLLRCAGKSWKHNPLYTLVLTLWTAYFVLLVVTQFTRGIYYYTPDNVYHRGPWYPLLLIPPAVMMVADIIGLYYYRDSLTHWHRIAFLIYYVVPFICMLIQMFFYGLLLIILGTSLAVLFMFIFLLNYQVNQSIRQQQEIASQRASITVLQMRPHFIYNTMMSIYYLCKQDSDLAQRVILDFSTYLRKNFTAIAIEEPIPFSEELEHTRAYLAVEQAQFEDGLFVDYDTPYVDFRLPPLTLQPIVENAVKHGMDPDSDPLCIYIRTGRTDSGNEIIVENTGTDFEPADDGDPHIALKNIRQRLSMMCQGEMTITSREGGGTVVKVKIPSNVRQDHPR